MSVRVHVCLRVHACVCVCVCVCVCGMLLCKHKCMYMHVHSLVGFCSVNVLSNLCFCTSSI